MKDEKVILFQKIQKGKPKKNPKNIQDHLTSLWAAVHKKKNRNKRITEELKRMKIAYEKHLETPQLSRFKELYALLERLIFLGKGAKMTTKQHEVYQLILNHFMVEGVQSPFLDTLGFRELIPNYTMAQEKKTKKKSRKKQREERKLEIIEQLKFKSKLTEIEKYFSVEEWNQMIDNPAKVDVLYNKILGPIVLLKQQEHYQKQAFDEHEAKEKIHDKNTSSTSISGTSVNSLYKQLAKKLHPDLTQNEEDKVRRTALMSEVTTAKEKKDIFTLLEIYGQNFDDSSISFKEDESEKLKTMLEKQLEELDIEKDELIGGPMEQYIYTLFTGKSGSGIDREGRHLAAQEKSKQENYTKILHSLNDEVDLKNFLQQWV
ncbi:hypothetical protein [Flammeovirga kamogawensis]|uniref:J domain-containing protein n=1 Tax=Flammeovirga kamogawensis TaxID=373891 RepID=A0ABX8GYZ2_9BACT|nr:hypothetical protein [Flammeovirga kamogawensis]MBB6459226.1 hypothetical protein [Flammeovirga kamogawensis]QWG08790.1 hypothetical protein KM029_07565 [Flammeovirga kamogawensis]TRX67080.1 hypothetical protein EO216_02610 [Flammeovirga kamogawensis]